MDFVRDFIQNSDVNHRALPDPFNIFRRLDNASVRYNSAPYLKLPDFLVKCLMAVLVFLSAAAPARCVAVIFCHLHNFLSSASFLRRISM